MSLQDALVLALTVIHELSKSKPVRSSTAAREQITLKNPLLRDCKDQNCCIY